MARLFVAAWPPEWVLEELAWLVRKDRSGVRFTDPSTWHMTLRFLGEADAGDVARALDDATLPPAMARLGPAVDVLSEHALVVPVAGLDGLATAVARATVEIGEPSRRRFVGHLTVARAKRGASMPSVLGAPVGTSFEVHEIALVRSTLAPEGARYATLETWPVPSERIQP